MFDKGYGIILSDCKFKDDAHVTLMDRFALENDDILEQFHDFCGNYGFGMGDPEAKKQFVETFYDEYVGGGIGGLIGRVINDAEFDGADYFAERDCCLFVCATVPVDDEDKASMPTQKEIQSLLSKYVNDLLAEPVKIDWVEVCE